MPQGKTQNLHATPKREYQANEDAELSLDELKAKQIARLKQRQEDKILETKNAEFLSKLINSAENKNDVLRLSALGMGLKRTGFHFDVRLEKSDRTIKYFARREDLSFSATSTIRGGGGGLTA